ncbi:unnamed protein product [Calypogeia fissa]
MVTIVEQGLSNDKGLTSEEEGSYEDKDDIVEKFMANKQREVKPNTLEQEANGGAEIVSPKPSTLGNSMSWDFAIPKHKDKKDRKSKSEEKTTIGAYHDFLRKFLEIFIHDFAIYRRTEDHVH